MIINNIKGGNVIASGGFGCVFKPALKCKGKSRNDKEITKLYNDERLNKLKMV